MDDLRHDGHCMSADRDDNYDRLLADADDITKDRIALQRANIPALINSGPREMRACGWLRVSGRWVNPIGSTIELFVLRHSRIKRYIARDPTGEVIKEGRW